MDYRSLIRILIKLMVKCSCVYFSFVCRGHLLRIANKNIRVLILIFASYLINVINRKSANLVFQFVSQSSLKLISPFAYFLIS